MSNLIDHLNNDLLALIAQHLPVKELLYFIRTDRRLHLLNSSDSSWSCRAFRNSHVVIQLREDNFFHQWLMKSHDYVYSVNTEASSSNDTSAINQPLYKGLISLSTWHSINHGFYYVLNRWFNEDADEMKNWRCSDHNKPFEMELAKRIIETRDNPPTTTITLESGEECEVLTEINENVLKHKISARRVPTYYTRLILSAIPYLRSLSFSIDAAKFLTPKFDDLLGLVPHLRSLKLCQWDSDQSSTNCSLIPIRQIMKYLTKLESLTIDCFMLSIQDLIDISSHPRLEFIKLDDMSVDEGMVEEDWEWFDLSYKFNSEQNQNQKQNEKIDISQKSADDKKQEIFENAAMNEFHVDGDDGEEDFIENNNHPSYDAWKPEQISADIEYLESSLLLPSSLASIRARLKLLNLLQSKLFRPHNSEYCRPLKYLRHLRHQIYILHSSLSQSLNNTLYNSVNEVVDNDENKRRRIGE